jgi:hypothetical protein
MLPVPLVVRLKTKFEGSRYSYVAVHYQVETATTAIVFLYFILSFSNIWLQYKICYAFIFFQYVHCKSVFRIRRIHNILGLPNPI